MAFQRTLLRAVALVSSLAHPAVRAWIPPHPDSTIEWESVEDMRRRLDLGFNYSTSRLVHPEMCRFLTEEECEEADKGMQEHVAAHKTLQTLVRNNPNIGSINVLVLMIRFSDHVNRDLIAKSDVDQFWQTLVPEWLDVNSQGRYDIKATVINWITTDNTEEYYSFGKRGTVQEAQQMAWPALDQLDNRGDWDWSQFDLDGNGQIDSLVVIHSGYGAETVTTDCFGADFNNRIWAHAFSSSRDTWKSKDGSIQVAGYTMASAFDGDCDTVPAKMGLTAHEYMHTLGLEDLYDGVDPIGASGIGAFDIMAYPYGQRGDANNPGHLSTWSKVLAEWVEPEEITTSGEFTLKAAEISDEAYRITLVDFGITAEYLLIENRQPLEFDVDLWSEGLVIYHIDDGANLQKNRGYPGQQGWPENGNHYEVAVLQKDGNYDLEQGVNIGDAGDFWAPGDTLGPGEGGTVYPNTDLYGQGFVQETGIWLKVLSQDGTDVTFQVGGFDGEEVATPSPTMAPTMGTPNPTQAPTTANPTQAPTVSPTKSTPIPTLAPTAGTPIPTLAPTAGTPIPTSATPVPTQTATAATSSPTQSPSKTFSTVAPTITPATAQPTAVPSASAIVSPPTISPTAQTPTPTMGKVTGVPETHQPALPFGSQEEMTHTPTGFQGSPDSYLSSFGPYVGSPTSSPRETSSLAPSSREALDNGMGGAPGPPSSYLSNFGSTPAASSPTFLLSGRESQSSPSNPSGPFLDNFESAAQVQLGPPQDPGEEEQIVFLSSAFDQDDGEEATDSLDAERAGPDDGIKPVSAAGCCCDSRRLLAISVCASILVLTLFEAF